MSDLDAENKQSYGLPSPAEFAAGTSPSKPGPAFDFTDVMGASGQARSAQNPAGSGEGLNGTSAGAAASGDASKPCPPNPDYDQYIDTASRYIYDPKQLGNISGLEHKYDCSIKSNEDVFTYANIALGVTGDRFDHAMDPAEVKEFEKMQRGAYSGVGMEIVPTMLGGRPNPAAAVGGDHPAGDIVITNVNPGKAAAAAGLKAGDSLVSVDGKDVRDINPVDLADLISSNKPGTKLHVVVDRHGERVEKTVTTQELTSPPVVHDKAIDKDIAYIKIDNFSSETTSKQLAAAMDKHKNAKAFVIDVRDNPGGLVDESLKSAALFVKDGTLMTSRQRMDSPADKPVYADMKVVLNAKNMVTNSVESDNGAKSTEQETRMPYMADGRPVVLLTNGNSASGAEIFTGALHDTAHDTTVGDTTFGKGIGQVVLKPMPDGGYLKVTALHYLTPAGNWPGDADKHRIGLPPDKPVPNLPGVEPGSVLDTQLQTAVDLLHQKIQGK